MKSWLVIVFVVFTFWPSAAQASNRDEADKDVSSELELIIKEIRALRARLEQLEKRIASILDGGPSTEKTDQQIRIIIPKRPKRDLGLYVFPGLDAPPLTPGNVKSD